MAVLLQSLQEIFQPVRESSGRKHLWSTYTDIVYGKHSEVTFAGKRLILLKIISQELAP